MGLPKHLRHLTRNRSYDFMVFGAIRLFTKHFQLPKQLSYYDENFPTKDSR